MSNPKFNVGDPAFIKDYAYGRVFPIIITEVICNPDRYEWNQYQYKVKLDITPGVHDELAFNGIAKPCPFDIPENRLFDEHDLFKEATAAYGKLIEDYKDEQEKLQEQLRRLPSLIEVAEMRQSAAAKTAGAVYPIGKTIWVIRESHYPLNERNVAEASITGFDRGDFQGKPYVVTLKERPHDTMWLTIDQIYKTRAAATKALKAILKQEYEKNLAAIG